jgi:hypothetical protein
MARRDNVEIALWWKIMAAVATLSWIVLILGAPAAMWARAIFGEWDKAISDALWVSYTALLVVSIVLTVVTLWIADDENYF